MRFLNNHEHLCSRLEAEFLLDMQHVLVLLWTLIFYPAPWLSWCYANGDDFDIDNEKNTRLWQQFYHNNLRRKSYNDSNDDKNVDNDNKKKLSYMLMILNCANNDGDVDNKSSNNQYSNNNDDNVGALQWKMCIIFALSAKICKTSRYLLLTLWR